MDFLDEFKKRGYFYQCINEESLGDKMNTQNIANPPCYRGFFENKTVAYNNKYLYTI